MTQTLRALLLSLLCMGSAWSQSVSPSSVVVFASMREPISGISLIKRADYVSFTISIGSSESDFLNRTKLLGETRKLITDILTKQGVRFETGPTSLVLDQPGSSSKFSSASASGANEAVVHVLVPLAKSADNIFDASSRIASSLAKVQLPSRTSLRYSPFRLAVENPERYRTELITKISQEVAGTRTAMKSNGKVSVSGLASPVQVRQLNDTDVEVSLSYAVSMEVP